MKFAKRAGTVFSSRALKIIRNWFLINLRWHCPKSYSIILQWIPISLYVFTLTLWQGLIQLNMALSLYMKTEEGRNMVGESQISQNANLVKKFEFLSNKQLDLHQFLGQGRFEQYETSFFIIIKTVYVYRAKIIEIWHKAEAY